MDNIINIFLYGAIGFEYFQSHVLLHGTCILALILQYGWTPDLADWLKYNENICRDDDIFNFTQQRKVINMATNDNMTSQAEYNVGDYVVYHAHGVGQVKAIEMQEISDMRIELYNIEFDKDRMRLKIPVMKAKDIGLRKVSSSERMEDAMETLGGKSKIRRTMWSRRAQEYETKINSGDPVAIAEVLRDLKRSNDDQEQSYSERQIFQSALKRLAREMAVVKDISESKATVELEKMLGMMDMAGHGEAANDAGSMAA